MLIYECDAMMVEFVLFIQIRVTHEKLHSTCLSESSANKGNWRLHFDLTLIHRRRRPEFGRGTGFGRHLHEYAPNSMSDVFYSETAQ